MFPQTTVKENQRKPLWVTRNKKTLNLTYLATILAEKSNAPKRRYIHSV